MDKGKKDLYDELDDRSNSILQDVTSDVPEQPDSVLIAPNKPASPSTTFEFGKIPEDEEIDDQDSLPADQVEETQTEEKVGDEEEPEAGDDTDNKDEDEQEEDKREDGQQQGGSQRQQEQTQQRMQAPPITKVKKEMPEWLIGLRDMFKMLFVTPVVLVQNLLVRLTGGKEAVKALREETADQIKADKVRQANKAEGDFLQEEINNLLKFRTQDPNYTKDGLTITSVEVFQPKMGKDDILYAIHVKCSNGSEYGAAEYALYIDQNRQLRTNSVVPREVALQLDELIRAVDLQHPDLSVGDVIEEDVIPTDEIPVEYGPSESKEQAPQRNTAAFSEVHNDCDGLQVNVVRNHKEAYVNIVATNGLMQRILQSYDGQLPAKSQAELKDLTDHILQNYADRIPKEDREEFKKTFNEQYKNNAPNVALKTTMEHMQKAHETNNQELANKYHSMAKGVDSEISKIINECEGIEYQVKAEFKNGMLQIDGLPTEADKAVVAQTIYQAYEPLLKEVQKEYAKVGRPQEALYALSMEAMMAHVRNSISDAFKAEQDPGKPTTVSMYIVPDANGQTALVASEHVLQPKKNAPQMPITIHLNARQLETADALNFKFSKYKDGKNTDEHVRFSQTMHPNVISDKLGGWCYRASNAEGAQVFRMNDYTALYTVAPDGKAVSAIGEIQHDGISVRTQNPITNSELKAIAEATLANDVDTPTVFSIETYSKAAEILAQSASDAEKNKSYRNYFVMGDSAFSYDGKELEMCKLGVDATYKVQMTKIDAQKLQEAYINGRAELTMESGRGEQQYTDEHDELPLDEPAELD